MKFYAKNIYRNMGYFQVSGQSYKQFTLVIYESRVVIYESRVVIWGIFKSGTTLPRVVIYNRRAVIGLATGHTDGEIILGQLLDI